MSPRRRSTGLSESDRKILLTQQRYDLAKLAVKWFFAALIVFLAVPYPVMLGEGKQTVITLTYQAIIEGKIADKLQKAILGGLTLLVYVQRLFYMRRLKHLGGRAKLLESKHDPNRSSSMLRSES